VLDATSDLLTEVGYEKLSVEDVASHAGVHKTTVYRRWPTKAELVFAAVIAEAEVNVPIPDSGSLHGDLQALARSVAANIGSDGGTRQGRTLVAAAASSNELAANMHSFWALRFAAAAAVVDRAIERGELPNDADANLIVETLVGPLWLRLLLTGEPIDTDFADQVAALVSAGASST
jgi:AcrR family transcriptional regulator